MSKCYFSWLSGRVGEENLLREVYDKLVKMAKEMGGVCYNGKYLKGVYLYVCFDNKEDRQKFNKIVQKSRGDLSINIDTTVTKSVESMLGDEFEVI